MFRNRSTHKKEALERVIIDEDIVNVATLRAEAKRAGTRFWVLLVLVSLVSSMVVPYLSMASIAASDTTVFTGDVIPGYSMGGIPIASYGVDINSWGKSGKQTASNPSIAMSQYGYWTKKRATNATQNLKSAIEADKEDENSDLHGLSLDDGELSTDEKARGWIGITRNKGEGTGLSGFSTDPSGTSVPNRTQYSESVAPYRTQADWTFWDSQSIGGSSPLITATVYPDFVIFGWDAQNKTARTLTNPDDIQNTSSSKSGASGALDGTSAVPHYVPLSTLFEEFGLGDTVMSQEKGSEGKMNNLDSLFDAIMAEAQKKGNDGKSPTLNKIVENKGHDPRYDLLIGTHYDNLNGSNKSQETGSDAWNPYPYSMVFKTNSGNGTVVSSIYGNTEAYVYFSPQSVYNNYIALRREYDSLVNASSSQVADAEPQAAFQLGYYLAGMSILEAYLNEALPQDMTRGYVGPAEGNPIASSTSALANANKLSSRSSASDSVSGLFAQSLSSVNSMTAADGSRNDSVVGFRTVAYSQLMYDFADAAIIRYGADGEGTWLGATSAIMNALSTYGYGVKDSGQNTNTEKVSAGQGPNRGMTRKQTMARVTMYGPYSKSAKSLNVSISSDKKDPLITPSVANDANTGMYIPPYYPIQQHEMPTDTEMPYRFQILSLIPYSTLSYELGQHGFDTNVTLSYNNKAVETLSPTKNYYNKVASLGKQLDDLNNGNGADLGAYDKGKSIVLNPQTSNTPMVGDQSTSAYARSKDSTERVDNALMSFQSGLMNADNVHDLVDIVRAIPGVKYETFMRYYNPIKSSGGADDLYLARITPAQTAYMPAVLTAGYESAGGTTNNETCVGTASANFDYFSIPSLGPCLAAKTAPDTYYGALNYELRPFYTKGFLNTLPSSGNVPALEQYEELQEEIEEKKGQAIIGMKTKILTIYVLAKRLSFARAYRKLAAAENSDGTMSVGGLYYSNKELDSIEAGGSETEKDMQEALKPTDPANYAVPANDSGKDSFNGKKTKDKVADGADVVGENDNKIETTTLSDGTQFGISTDGKQVEVDGNTYEVEVDGNGNISATGASEEINKQIQSAASRASADQAAAAAAAVAAGAAGYYYDQGTHTWRDTNGNPAPNPATTAHNPSATTAHNPSPTSPSYPSDTSPRALYRTNWLLVEADKNRSSNRGITATRVQAKREVYHISNTPPEGLANSIGSSTYSSVSSGRHRGHIALRTLGWTYRLVADLFLPTTAYAAPSSDAKKVYEEDKLEARGYIKASSEDWAKLKKGMSVTDTLTFHLPSDMKIPRSGDFDYAMQEFGPKHILGDDLTKKVVWCKTSDGLAFVTDLKTVFGALYNDAYTHFLAAGSGDSYYWDVPSEIAKYDVNVDKDQTMRKDEKLHYNTVAISYSDAANENKAKKNLDEYCEKAFEELDAIMKELQMLSDDLPKQMQNVLAWADVQTASESETNYSVSPDDKVMEIRLGVKEDETSQTNTIHSLHDAIMCGFLPIDNEGNYALTESTAMSGDNNQQTAATSSSGASDMQARAIRGVSGTTATSSERLAAYTITATIARISWFVPTSSSSSGIPYAGIYNGSLNSGTDKYALLQAHTIDRDAVTSALSGDLRNRSSASVQASLANSSSTVATQRFVQAEGTFANELQASVIPNAISVMQDSMSRTMPSDDTSSTQPIKSAKAGTLEGMLLASDGTNLAMARASTFDGATMNRRSSSSVTYNASSQRMVYQSGSVATASASSISTDRQWAKSLVNGGLSDTYATIQSIALLMVLAFLMVIAFQNFVGYTSGQESEYISAQTKLKTVLPRALIAVAMIGLPPMGGQQGFPGGCYLLLQIVNAMLDAVVGSFTGGTDMFNVLMEGMAESFTIDFNLFNIVKSLFDILINVVASVLFLVGSIFVTLLCLATDVVLFLFWMLGPIIWALYVWPYSAQEASKVSGHKSTTGFFGKMTGYLGLKNFTRGEVGRDAPSGWVMGYISVLSTIVMWNLMFWVFAIVLTMMKDGNSMAEAMSSLGTSTSNAASVTIGSPDIYDPGSVGNVVSGGGFAAIPDTAVGHLILSLLFLLVVYAMYRIFKNSMGGAMRCMYGVVGFGAKVASSLVLGKAAAAAKGADLAGKASAALEAKGTADTILGKAVSVGAKGADSVLHVVGTAGKAADNVINSPAGADFGNRFGKLIDNLSQDVPERAKSSGAFDDLAIVEPSFDEKGRPTGAKVRLSPVVKGVGDLAKRELAGFKKVKMQHQKNKALSQMTSLANTDNECVERLDGYKDVAAVENRLAAMSESSGNPVTISDFAADIKSRMEGHVSGSKRLSDDEMDTLRADAALLGIGGDVVDTMTKGSSIGGFADSMFSDASDRMEHRTSERNAIQGHRDLIQARASAIIARAETVDPQFAEEARQHWAGLQTDRVLTSGEREMRKASTVAAGVAKQAAGVVDAANGSSTIQNLADGGRLGAGTLGDTSDSGVYEEWADYSIDQQEKSAQSDEIGILASATAGANEASDTPDADLADLAEKKKSRDIANLDTVMNS